MNLYKKIPAYHDKKEGIVNVVIDIPKGSTNKYEYDEEGGYFKLDRVIHHSMFYPFDYGFIPSTTELDGDAVDVFLLGTYPTFSGCVIKARLLGVLDVVDEKGQDPKLIAVPIHKIDPRWDEYQGINDIPKHIKEELGIFFKEYKKLETKKYEHTVVHGFGTKGEAYEYVDKAIIRYEKKQK
ncbi:MAG: inorganic diphosphatase [Candidatus Absconditabacterales bacterium]|nr:inorganic diphosphatase [Candidatus Absconditabacterales bacterium]